MYASNKPHLTIQTEFWTAASKGKTLQYSVIKREKSNYLTQQMAKLSSALPLS